MLVSALVSTILHQQSSITIFSVRPRILDIIIYFRIRHSFAHLRPVILSADWSIHQSQSWTCSSLPTVAQLVKLPQCIVIEIQRQSTDLYKVQLCNQQFFVGVPAIYMVKVYECHPLGKTNNVASGTLSKLKFFSQSCHCRTFRNIVTLCPNPTFVDFISVFYFFFEYFDDCPKIDFCHVHGFIGRLILQGPLFRRKIAQTCSF